MKVSLVTGCAGFIGSHMVDFLLKKKHLVYGIDNLSSGKIINISHNFKSKKFIFFNKDLKHFEKISKTIMKIDFVFHFAGNGELIPSIENPYSYFKNNALNSALLIDLIRRRKYKVKKFIYAASSSCYGLSDIKTSENVKINIQHPYAFSKYVGEQAVLHWGKVYKIPTISIRIFNAYGPRSRTTNVYGAVIGVFIKQLITKKPLTIVGDGSQKRDFLYITDLCDAFYKAAISKSKNEIFNLGSGKPQSVMSLAKMIFNKYTYLPWRPGEPKKTHANINKIQNQLKWFPKVSLKRGIKNVLKNIDWWNDAPLWTPSKIKKATKNWHKYLG
jgi:UDP-glucose 4-epimerase